MESRGAVIFMPRDIDGPSLMLEELLFDPAAAWLSAALERGGVDRFLVVCHEGDRAARRRVFLPGHNSSWRGQPARLNSCWPFSPGWRETPMCLPGCLLDDRGASRLTGPNGEELPGGEESGVYAISAQGLYNAVQGGEDFVTALRAGGSTFGLTSDSGEGLLLLDRSESAWDRAQAAARRASVNRLRGGSNARPIRFVDPDNVYIGPRVRVGGGTRILPGVILRETRSSGLGVKSDRTA